MNYGAIIYNLLSTDTDLTDIVPAARIKPVTVSQDLDMPAIAYTKQVKPVDVIHGANCIETVLFNVYVFHDHPDDLDTLTQQIRKTLSAQVVPYTDGDFLISDITFTMSDHEGYDKDLRKYFNMASFAMLVKSNIE